MTNVEWVPRSCDLPTAEQPLRVAEWDALFAARLTAVSRPEPLRVRLALFGDAGVQEQVMDLAGRESDCCSFFTFLTATTGDGLTLDISVPVQQTHILTSLADRAQELSA